MLDLVHHFNQMWNFVRYENKIKPDDTFAPSLFETDIKSAFSTKKIEEEPKPESVLTSIGNKWKKVKREGR